MPNYKSPSNKLHVIDVGFEHLLPAGCVQITDAEAATIKDAEKAVEDAKPKPQKNSLVDQILADPSELAKLKNALK